MPGRSKGVLSDWLSCWVRAGYCCQYILCLWSLCCSSTRCLDHPAGLSLRASQAFQAEGGRKLQTLQHPAIVQPNLENLCMRQQYVLKCASHSQGILGCAYLAFLLVGKVWAGLEFVNMLEFQAFSASAEVACRFCPS